MPKGGKRPGAGRKSGAAWDGAQAKGEAIRAQARQRVRAVLAGAEDPLTILVQIARDAGVDTTLRVQAATAACPYVYPRLSAAIVATAAAPKEHDSAAIVDRILGKIARMAPTLEHQPQTKLAAD